MSQYSTLDQATVRHLVVDGLVNLQGMSNEEASKAFDQWLTVQEKDAQQAAQEALSRWLRRERNLPSKPKAWQHAFTYLLAVLEKDTEPIETEIEKALFEVLLKEARSPTGWLSDGFENIYVCDRLGTVEYFGEGSIDIHQIAEYAAHIIEKGNTHVF